MMVFKNKIIILFLLLSISLFSCYNITNYSNNNVEKYYTSEGLCLVSNIYILCEQTDINDDCTTLTLNKPEYSNGNPVSLMGDEKSKFFLYNFVLPTGNEPIIINSVLVLNYQCLELDLDKVSLNLVNGLYYFFASSGYNNYFGPLLIGGLELVGDYDESADLSFVLPMGSYSVARSISAKSNMFLIYSDGSLKETNTLSPLTLRIKNNTASKEFEIPPFSNNVFDNIFDVKTYPDLEYLINLDTFGLGQGAILEFKMNNTANTQFLININGTSINTQYHPIAGNEFSTTYLYSLSKFDLASLYELYYINNNKFIKSTSFETKINKYNFPTLPTTGTVYSSYPNNLLTITYGFTDDKVYEFAPIMVSVGGAKTKTRFPFGYTNGSPTNGYKYIINSLVKDAAVNLAADSLELQSTADNNGVYLFFDYMDTIINNPLDVPKIYDYQFTHLVDEFYLLRLNISAPNSVYYIQIQDRYYYGKDALVSGDLNDGVYEMVCNTLEAPSIKIYDVFKFNSEYFDTTPLSVSPIKLFKFPSLVPEFNFATIDQISYLYNDIDVTNHRHYNILYFNCSTLPKEDGKLAIIFPGIQTVSNSVYLDASKPNFYYARYNESIQLFQVEFYVECNSPMNYVVFTMLSNLVEIRSPVFKSQLRVKKSNLDLQGPVFKDIKKLLPLSIVDETNNIAEIGWTLSIQDSINGFKSGYVVIKGEIDQSIYNISISSNDVKSGGNEFLGDYDIKIQIYYPCFSQNYIISEIGLYDKILRFSYFSTLDVPNPDYSGVLNPFIYFLNDTNINKIQLTCSIDPIASSDTTPPVLTSLTYSKPSVNVDQPDREVTVTFIAEDLESGLKNNTFPIVYFTTVNNRIVECISSIVSIDKQSATYECTIQFPFGFGFPDGIIMSVYGLINNNGMFNGYSTFDLMDLEFIYSIFPSFTSVQPTLLNHYKISERGGDLWIWGRGLNYNSKAYITFSDGSTEIVDSTASYSSALLFKVRATDKPYKLYVYIDDLKATTNTLVITPTVYDFYIPINPEFINSESSSDSSAGIPPLPTNVPQQCPGNPICGGPTHGKCIENQGCLCNSPWFGKDCLSQIIIIDPPVIGGGDNTGPIINITIPGNNNSESTVVTYHSLISIVALREVNILGNTINYYPFKNDWTSQEIDQFTYNFYNQFSIVSKDNQIITTNITVTLKWFVDETTISFANQELKMNPSSLKYTINISSYPFESNLNVLQLVMSALLDSNTTENVCSSREFGETSAGDNSNYIKIQIDNHSLYGRFIRRGIVDSQIRSITNVLLDSSMNPITQTKAIQTYIGIQIPYYNNHAILDPDFSVLIDPYSANSICSNKSLSGAKIAGIVIGSVAFTAIIIISVAYYINKKQRDKKLISNIQQKIGAMNNDKL